MAESRKERDTKLRKMSVADLIKDERFTPKFQLVDLDHPLEYIVTAPEIDYYDDRPVLWGDGAFTSTHTSEEAFAQRVALVKNLAAQPPVGRRRQLLIELLNSCRPYHRCKSYACPECVRPRQRWLMCEGSQLMCRAIGCSVGELPARYSVVHAIPSFAKANGGRRPTANIAKAQESVRCHLFDCGIDFCVGALNVFFARTRGNDGDFGELRRVVRASLLIPGGGDDHRLSALAARFPDVAGVGKPFVAHPFDGNPAFFERALSSSALMLTFGAASEQNVFKRRIDTPPVDDQAKLAVHLDRAGAENCILIHTESEWSEFGRLYL